jgi:hypothetical protein
MLVARHKTEASTQARWHEFQSYHFNLDKTKAHWFGRAELVQHDHRNQY